MRKTEKNDIELLKTWTLPSSATLGSSVRAKGILLEVRARLPAATKKSLDMEAGELILAMSAGSKTEFHAASAAIAKILEDIRSLPVIPREIQDILSITATERHRWLKDGRLPSAGTRTVKLRGRARKITFHVFDPRKVEDLLDQGLVDTWREEDAAAAAENRRRAAYRAKLTRSLKNQGKVQTGPRSPSTEALATLSGWEEFVKDGLLR